MGGRCPHEMSLHTAPSAASRNGRKKGHYRINVDSRKASRMKPAPRLVGRRSFEPLCFVLLRFAARRVENFEELDRRKSLGRTWEPGFGIDSVPGKAVPERCRSASQEMVQKGGQRSGEISAAKPPTPRESSRSRAILSGPTSKQRRKFALRKRVRIVA